MKLPSVEANSEVIRILKVYPDLQMHYIENILEQEIIDKDVQVKKELRLQFLKLKCQHDPDSIVKILYSYQFPLLEGLKICEEMKNHQAIAYFYNRLGQTEEAIGAYMSVSSIFLIKANMVLRSSENL